RTGVIAEFQAPEFGFNRPWPEQGYVADMADDPTLDGGLVLLVSVGDYVWFDFNRDGIQDPDEEPVADVTVTLRDQTGAVVDTTTTDENGFYSFINLYPGVEYTLEFERPERFDNWTVQGGGDEDNP